MEKNLRINALKYTLQSFINSIQPLSLSILLSFLSLYISPSSFFLSFSSNCGKGREMRHVNKWMVRFLFRWFVRKCYHLSETSGLQVLSFALIAGIVFLRWGKGLKHDLAAYLFGEVFGAVARPSRGLSLRWLNRNVIRPSWNTKTLSDRNSLVSYSNAFLSRGDESGGEYTIISSHFFFLFFYSNIL